MKKYVALQCDTCKRTKDQLLDNTHYTPDRCTITLNCEGRLSPIGYTSDGTTVLSVPPVGLTNWYARGTVLSTEDAVQADVLYDTSTGSTQQVVIAVSNTALGLIPSDTAILTLNLIAEQQTSKDYRQYTYRRGTTFTVLNGMEDAVSHKVLRYVNTGLNPDQVEVYVNGVKRNQGAGTDDYQLNDGTDASFVPINSIAFNTAITGSTTQVDVIVTKAANITTLSLAFNRAIYDESRVGTGAWEGVNSISTIQGGTYSLFYCDFLSAGNDIALGIKLRVDPGTPPYVTNTTGGAQYTVTDGVILLSREKLFTEIDRLRAVWAPLNLLNSNTDYLVVKLVDASRRLLITEASVVNLFPPMQVIRYETPKLITANLLGDVDAAQIDNTIIVGPDA